MRYLFSDFYTDYSSLNINGMQYLLSDFPADYSSLYIHVIIMNILGA